MRALQWRRWTPLGSRRWLSAAPAATEARPSEAYRALVAGGDLAHDRAQWLVLRQFLDRLHTKLEGYTLPSFESPPVSSNDDNDGDTKPEEPVKPVLVPRGLYVHGSVGTGKSMLMDLFFRRAPLQRKRRVHFNKFMLEVHERLARIKKQQLAEFGRQRNLDLDPRKDAIALVALDIAEESHLLCFDEFQVTDVADALIMRKLFGVFFDRGVVVVATSNTPPTRLYEGGTNREYFLPFLDQLARHTRVVDMSSDTDYRMLAEPFDGEESFLYPLSEDTASRLDAVYYDMIDRSGQDEETLRVPVMMGRSLTLVGSRSGVCRASFDYLCGTEKGAADYKALCECFHTLVLEGVPRLAMKDHDKARRFILLIDELYEHHARLVCSSAESADRIFAFDDDVVESAAQDSAALAKDKQQQRAADQAQGVPPASSWDGPVQAYNPAKLPGLQIENLVALQDLKVAFKRAVSRLREMQSERYFHEHDRLSTSRRDRLASVLEPEA